MEKKPEILSQEFKMTFTQDSDCNSIEDQFLTIKTDNGGGGDYYIIETERWAFDSIDELVEVLNKFKEKHEKIEEKDL
jgi:hypothetical protein